MDNESGKQCPRCDAGRLRAWSELNDEEREVVKRLPASTDYSIEERAARDRWCTRCWYEDFGVTPVDT
jgi:hypothetical protein